MVKWFIYIAFVIMPATLFAQDFEADLEKINLAYTKYNNLSMDTRYIQLDKDGKKVAEENGQMKKQGKRLYTRVGEVESIYFEDMSILIDHSSRLFVIDKPASNDIMENGLLKVQLSSMAQLFTDIKHKHLRKNKAVYMMKTEQPPYKSMEIYYDTDTWLLDKIRIEFDREVPGLKEEGHIEIQFLNIKIDAPIGNDFLNKSKYITVSRKTYKKQAKYVDYEFVNKLKTN